MSHNAVDHRLSASEWLFCVVFVAANLLIPPLCIEFYPFSIFPMYDRRLSMVTVYRIFAPDRKELRAEDFCLDLVSYGADGKAVTPFHRHRARTTSLSRNVLGYPPLPNAEVVQIVQKSLQNSSYPYVKVVRFTLDAVDAERAGPIRVETFKVARNNGPP